MAAVRDVDFRQIRTLEGRQDVAFEEFCCQIARRTKDVPHGSRFMRYRGAGGDGGVECIWALPNGEEWGWQAKYFFQLNKRQLDKSVETALEIHPALTRYYICVPFDFTGPTARSGKSEVEKFDEYAQEWKLLANSREMQVEFIRLDRSGLLDQLLEFDPHGGRLRFWFGIEQFGETWFQDHLMQTARAAEPRYTPKLSVDVPVATAFEALGRTPRWQEAVLALMRRLDKSSRDWPGCFVEEGWTGDEPDFSEGAKESAEQLSIQLAAIKQALNDILDSNERGGLLAKAVSLVDSALSLAAECHSIAKERLETKYGEGMADSVGFRHFMQDYEARFPAWPVDAAREVMAILEEIRDWLSGPEASLSVSSAMLLLGAAGIGKTHSICDIALDRHSRGLRNIALLGEKFNHVTGEPWERIRSLLGLGVGIARDELYTLLDTAGESTGYPLIVFVDALNETHPREFWHDYLSDLVGQIARCSWLRLCVSCRSTYYEDVIARNVQMVEVEHTGFAGVEFEACFDFFRYYELDPPSMPLMQPEFSNPLFLRLVCESLSDAGVKRIPEGMLGIVEVVHRLLDSKNRKLAELLDYDPKQRLVQDALDLIVSAMQANRTAWLPWQEAKSLVDSVWPSQHRESSLFHRLIREGLIREDRVPVDLAPVDAVFISFDRLADILLAEKYLSRILEMSENPRQRATGPLRALRSGICSLLSKLGLSVMQPPQNFPCELLRRAFAPDGSLHFAVCNRQAVREHRGLLEALAILVPEKHGMELSQSVRGYVDDSTILLLSVDSLVSRTDDSVTSETESLIQEGLSNKEVRNSAIDAVLAVGTRADNRLNALWFHDFLASMPMPDRDAAWCPFLHTVYGRRGSVDRLINWALSVDLGAVSDQTAEMWAVQLCWFCAAADRRVRDYATKALIRLMADHLDKWPQIIERFSQVDDDYVLERCLAAAYGAFTRAHSDSATRGVASTAYEAFFQSGIPPQNAMIRDYARLVLELALHRHVLPEHANPERFRPPYESEWPLEWPDEDFVEPYKDTYWELPKLYSSCFFDDFATYTAPYALRALEDAEKPQALRWIFKHVLDMGFTQERFAGFDGHLLAEYGPGRSKPVWAERIGKKYQWIALYRLLARVADHVPQKESDTSAPPPVVPALQAQDERNIDPTILLKEEQRVYAVTWWAPVDYDFQAVALLSDDDWLDVPDFPDTSRMLQVMDAAHQREWFVLQAFMQWTSKNENQDDRLPYQKIWMHIRSYLIQKKDVSRCWHWLPRQDFMGRWMPEGFDIHGGFLGEYPWGLPFVRFFELARSEGSYDAYESSRLPCRMVPTAHAVQCAYEYDAYQEGGMGILVPAQEFFKDGNLIWNVDSGYVSESGTLCFNYPATHEAGPSALLADKQYLLSFLEENELALAWTVLSEKQCVHDIQSHELGYSKHSRGHMLVDGKIRNTRGITARVRPTG